VGRRLALLIGTSCSPDVGAALPDLAGPPNDLALLGSILSDASIGGFDTRTLLDRTSGEVQLEVELALRHADPDDLVLIYFSGHGKLDALGDLCLVMHNTHAHGLRSTSLPIPSLRDFIRASNCERIVVILDCCYSGAAGRAFLRGGVPEQVGQIQQGKGRFVLSSATSTETSREREHVEDGCVYGTFTYAMAQGIRSGAADVNHDGQITVSDLCSYVVQNVREQTPQHWGLEVNGDILIAHNPHLTAAPLEQELQLAIRSRFAEMREGAVGILAQMLGSPDQRQVLAARDALAQLREDDSRRVSRAATRALAQSQDEPRHQEPEAQIPDTTGSPQTPAEAPTEATSPGSPETMEVSAGETSGIPANPPLAPKAPSGGRVRLAGIAVTLATFTLLAVVGASLYLADRNREPEPSSRSSATEPSAPTEQSPGFVTISASPATARLLIDGRDIGAADGSEYEVPSTAELGVRLTADGYADYEATLTLKPEERKDLQIRLEPLPARLEVRSNVSDDALSINGDPRGTTGPASLELEPGVYQIEVSKPGYEDFNLRVTLAPGESRTVRAMLTPTPVQRTPADLSELVDCDVCPRMVVIPAGTYSMGSPSSEPSRDNDEDPVHSVTLPRFAAGKYEVTFAEWDACVAANGCNQKPGDRSWGRELRPVINVSWQDAQEYVRWLSKLTGKNYRLLSESEWEYACRAGTQTPFSFGDQITPSLVNYDGNYPYAGGKKGEYREKTVPVGTLPANEFGLHEMHGNVWEWVQDCYKNTYEGAPSDGTSRETEGCASRVLRGGSWYDSAGFVRSANRFHLTPDYRDDIVGFRVARTLP